jgi:hypothetical protein
LPPLSRTALPPVPAIGYRLKAGVTVYSAEAEYVVPSDAVTMWIPVVTAGTVNAQGLKLPFASVVQDVETLLPSKVKVMVAFALKPRPLIAVLLPPAPELGVRLMAGLTV